MSNEPVAHFYPEGEGCTVYDIQFAWKVTGTTEPIPLYTHPVKELTDDPLVNFKPVWQEKPELTLTDEEILESFAFYFGSTLNNKAYNDGAILFAKDILRKAQEK